MPGMDGAECTAKIRSHLTKGEIKNLMVIQCTANDSEADKRRSLAAGADAFMTKPVYYVKLLAAIETALRK